MTNVVSKIDLDELKSSKVNLSYPCFEILDIGICIPVVVRSLIKGDVQIFGTLNGVSKVVNNISLSPLNVLKLLKVTPINFYLSENEVYKIRDTNHYLEVLEKWIL